MLLFLLATQHLALAVASLGQVSYIVVRWYPMDRRLFPHSQFQPASWRPLQLIFDTDLLSSYAKCQTLLKSVKHTRHLSASAHKYFLKNTTIPKPTSACMANQESLLQGEAQLLGSGQWQQPWTQSSSFSGALLDTQHHVLGGKKRSWEGEHTEGKHYKVRNGIKRSPKPRRLISWRNLQRKGWAILAGRGAFMDTSLTSPAPTGVEVTNRIPCWTPTTVILMSSSTALPVVKPLTPSFSQ